MDVTVGEILKGIVYAWFALTLSLGTVYEFCWITAVCKI